MVDRQSELQSTTTLVDELTFSTVSEVAEDAGSSDGALEPLSHFTGQHGPLLRFDWKVYRSDGRTQGTRQLHATFIPERGHGGGSEELVSGHSVVTIVAIVVVSMLMALATVATVLGCLGWRNRSKKAQQQVRRLPLDVDAVHVGAHWPTVTDACSMVIAMMFCNGISAC
jgi:hypothetical protein